MGIVKPLVASILCLFTLGCENHREVSAPSSKQSSVQPEAVALFYRVTPPCSSGDHYLHISDDADEYVWLFGAYNNGRHEENILIEKTGQSVRMRAFWHTNSGDLFCVDSQIGLDEIDRLKSTIDAERVFQLPTIEGDVSHAMAYWLKAKCNSKEHEACAYGIGLGAPSVFDQYLRTSDKNWDAVVTEILGMRKLDQTNLRYSYFDEQGNVVWDGDLVPKPNVPAAYE